MRLDSRHLIVATGLMLSAAAPAWAQSAVEDWPAVVAKAKQEGVVVVHGAPGKSYGDVFTVAFNKAYPDIKVQFSGASNRTDVPKLLRERKANIYAWDVWTSGPETAISVLKPEGVFQPLAPILRAETMDNSKWNGGFAAGWMDVEEKFFYAFDGTVQNPIMVNWDVVPKSALTSVADLLKPQFAGKIVWDDPRLGGSGNGSAQTIAHNLGEELLTKLFVHNVTFTSNKRQLTEWVVRGRYPIGIGVDGAQLEIFQAQGIGKNVGPVPDSFYKVQQQSPGFGGIGFVDKAPHPNAAAVYVNWLLSQEGQKAWSAIPRTSRRIDVTPSDPTLAPQANLAYFNGQAEKYSKERRQLLELAKRTITAEMPPEAQAGAE
jgi:iron(III) transport system substrate-binding protein